MNASFKASFVEFNKAWTMIENVITAVFFLSAILFFIGFAIYSAAHNVKF